MNQRWRITGSVLVLAAIIHILLPVSGQTPTPTTATVTVTITASVTATPTPEPAATATATHTPTTTRTATATATRTVTNTATTTASTTPSATQTPQPSPTPAVTVITGTPEPSRTPRPTNTRFPTNTVIPTLTPTYTPRIVTTIVTSPPQVITAVVPATPVPEPDEPGGAGSDERPDNQQPSGTDNTTGNTGEGAREPRDEYGWSITQSEDLIRTVGQWPVRNDAQANAGAKSVSASAGAVMTFPFEGTGFMVVYEVFEQGKPFQVVIDGDVQQIVDTQSGGGREPGFYAAGPFWVDDNYHVADLVSLVSESGRGAVSIDHVARFVGPPRPYRDDTPDENQQDNTGTDNPQTRQSLPVASYSLQSRPPTAIPSPTPVAESVLRVEVLLAYDDNANQEADFNEGINGMSVRVVDGTTNRILGSAITGEQGIVQLQIQTLRTVRVVVPALRRVFTKFVLFTGCVCFGRQRTQFANFFL